ncbi:MAG: acyltransferase family protein [Bacteroidia bacterium]
MKLNNIKQLDGLRALAILLVLIWHYFYGQVNMDLFQGMHYLKSAIFWTWSGVDLFFVLSGFLIGRILICNRESKNYFKTFYKRRIFRIFPAYYLVLMIFLIFRLKMVSPQFPFFKDIICPFYSYLFYIQNFWMAHSNNFGSSGLGVTWSLAIEEQFYLILPLLIFIINPKYLPGFLIAFILFSAVCRALIHGLGSYVLLPARMDSLLMGVLIAHYFINGDLQKFFYKKVSVLVFLILILFIALIIISKSESYGGIFIHSILALLYGALLIIVLSLEGKSLFIRILSHSSMLFVAKISYMIYLTHQLFSGFFHQILLHQNPKINCCNDAVVTLLALIVTVLFSAGSYYYFEKPILEFGKKYEY